MKLKIKLTTRKIFFYIFLLVIVGNFVALFFTYSFVEKNVYGTMFMTEEELLRQSAAATESIKVDKFKEVIETIEEKTEKKDMEKTKDIFN